MAPEVVDQVYDGQLADAWSIGVILFLMVAGGPPFERADCTCGWYSILLRREGHAGFFALHRKFGSVFSPELQDLLTQLLQFDPGSRLSVERMQQHPWLAGEQLSPRALQLEMQGRLQTLRNPRAVREAVRQAQALTQQQEQQAQQQQQQQHRLDERQARAVAGHLQAALSSSEQEREAAMQPLPVVPPSLGVTALPSAARSRRSGAEGVSPSSLLLREGYHSSPDWQEERKVQAMTSSPVTAAIRPRAALQPAPSLPLTAHSPVETETAAVDSSLPVFDPEQTQPATTPLFSRLSAAELQERLRLLLLLNHFRPVSDDKQRSITAGIDTPSGPVRLRLQLWRDDGEQGNGRIRIEMRRLEGDNAQCRQIFADLLLQMDDMVIL